MHATGWGDRFTETAKAAYESMVLTVRFLRTETTMPISEIHDFDTTMTNAIGVPYVIMSFVAGSPMSEKWFDEKGPTSLEQRRERTLVTVAEAMVQLQKFDFDAINASMFDKHGRSAGCVLATTLMEARLAKKITARSSMFTLMGLLASVDPGTNTAWKQASTQERRSHFMSDRGNSFATYSITSLFRPVPDSWTERSSRENFVLSVPDFDSQTFMVDNERNLTGIMG